MTHVFLIHKVKVLKIFVWPYNVEHEKSHGLETVRERNGQQTSSSDRCPKYTGQVTCRLMRQRHGRRHTIGVHEAGVRTLRGGSRVKSMMILDTMHS